MHSLIPFMVIILTMQSKLGAKINILAERACEYINGSQNVAPNNTNNSNVKVLFFRYKSEGAGKI